VDSLAGIADRALLETLAFVRAQPAPVSADEAAKALAIHRNAARSRLDRLAQADLLAVAFERRTGRSGPGAGRPAKVYAAAPETRIREYPRHRLEDLFSSVVDALPKRGRTQRLRRIGEDFGRRLAADAELEPSDDVTAGLEAACDAVRRLGFQATLARVNGTGAEIATPTCPLRPLVITRPELAELDRAMWAGLVEQSVRTVEAADVRCETRSCLENHASCSVLLELRLDRRAAPQASST